MQTVCSFLGSVAVAGLPFFRDIRKKVAFWKTSRHGKKTSRHGAMEFGEPEKKRNEKIAAS